MAAPVVVEPLLRILFLLTVSLKAVVLSLTSVIGLPVGHREGSQSRNRGDANDKEERKPAPPK